MTKTARHRDEGLLITSGLRNHLSLFERNTLTATSAVCNAVLLAEIIPVATDVVVRPVACLNRPSSSSRATSAGSSSRTLTSVSGKGVELVTSDAGEFVCKSKVQPGKDIVVISGGNFATNPGAHLR